MHRGFFLYSPRVNRPHNAALASSTFSPRLFEGGQAFGTLVLRGWTRRIGFPGRVETLFKEIVTEAAEEKRPAGEPAAGEESTAKKDLSDKSDKSDKSGSSAPAEPAAETARSWLHRWSLVLGKLQKILSILFERRLVRADHPLVAHRFQCPIRLVRIRRLCLKVRAGVGDPAETGKLYGWGTSPCAARLEGPDPGFLSGLNRFSMGSCSRRRGASPLPLPGPAARSPGYRACDVSLAAPVWRMEEIEEGSHRESSFGGRGGQS